MKYPLLLRSLSFIALVLIFSSTAYACGCGIALSDIKVFNALKETQAYLLIDVKDNSSYDEMPFFRFVSMDKPYNVTIVFPMDQIPYDVQGEKISAREFLNKYGINEAERFTKEQDFGLLVKNAAKDAFTYSNGLFIALVTTTMSGASLGKAAGAVAHFEFEGGYLDIYNVSSMQSLEEFARASNVNLTGEVKDLVEKYKDYYVAVLYLSVPSVVSEGDLDKLQRCLPEGLERVKERLANESDLTRGEIYEIVSEEASKSACKGNIENTLENYIASATYASDNVEGTLVIMSFGNSSGFFYPTSVVNFYKYPINDQKYYIKVPDKLHVDLSSSEISKTANFKGNRWYKIESTKEDLKGDIVEADFFVRVQDRFRSYVMGLQNSIGWIAQVFILMSLVFPFMVWSRSEKLGFTHLAASIGAFLVGGLLLSAFSMFLMKKKKLALTFLVIWIILLACAL